MGAVGQLVDITPLEIVAFTVHIVVVQHDVHGELDHPRRELKVLVDLLGDELQADHQVSSLHEFRLEGVVQLQQHCALLQAIGMVRGHLVHSL
jgi:hypothetical protein